ncbi:MAG: hypothetical protein AABW75_00485 [Nanoarchaeota archaeon]
MRIITQIIAMSLIFVILLTSSVHAITATLGNSRMILRMNVSDSMDKYLLIKNTNPVSVKIEISASGDLEKSITIKDSAFTLSPNEERNAYFTIKATKSGTTETRLNVRFIPDEGSAVGLSAVVVVVASGSDDGLNTEQEFEEPSDVQNNNVEIKKENSADSNNKLDKVSEDNSQDLENNVKINFDNKSNSDSKLKVTDKVSVSGIKFVGFIPKMLISITITLILLLVLLIVYSKKFRKKKGLKEGHV